MAADPQGQGARRRRGGPSNVYAVPSMATNMHGQPIPAGTDPAWALHWAPHDENGDPYCKNCGETLEVDQESHFCE